MMKTKASIVGMCLTVACSVPGKSVGVESNDTGGDGDGDGDGGATTGGNGGTDVGQSDSDEGNPTAGPTAGGSEGEDGSCPPGIPEPPLECASCALTPDCQWACDFAGCNLDCSDDACGEPCAICETEDCSVGMEGECDQSGTCVPTGGPDLCMSALQPGFEDTLTQQYGCADMFVGAVSAGNDLSMVLYLDQWGVNEVESMTAWPDVSYDAADTFEVRIGSNVSEADCNDAIVVPPEITEVWTAVAGTMDIVVIPGEDAASPTASVELSDVVLEGPDGATVDLPAYTFDSIVVGWLPG